VGREDRDAAQVKAAIPEQREEHRVLPGGASNSDAEVRLGLREVENFGCVFEHRRASLASKEPAIVDPMWAMRSASTRRD